MQPIDSAWFRQMQAARNAAGLPATSHATRAAQQDQITGPSFIDYFNQPHTPATPVNPAPAAATPATSSTSSTTPAPVTPPATTTTTSTSPLPATAIANPTDPVAAGPWKVIDGLGFKLSNPSLGPGPAYMGNLDAGPGWRLTVPSLGPAESTASDTDSGATTSDQWVQATDLGFTLGNPTLGPGPAFMGNLDAGPGWKLTVPSLGPAAQAETSTGQSDSDSGLWQVVSGLGFTLSNPSLGPGPAFMGNLDAGPGWKLTVPSLGASASDSGSLEVQA